MLTRQFGQVQVPRKSIGEHPDFVRQMFRDVDALIVETVNDFCNDGIRYLFHSPLLPEMGAGAQPLQCVIRIVTEVDETEADSTRVEITSFEIVWAGKQ